MPEDSVRHKGRTLLEKIGCKSRVGGFSNTEGRLTVKVNNFTVIMFSLSFFKESGIGQEAIKCFELPGNAVC